MRVYDVAVWRLLVYPKMSSPKVSLAGIAIIG